VNFVLIENCMNCPGLVGSNNKNCETENGEDYGDLSIDEIKKKRDCRELIDKQLALMNLLLYRLAEVNVVGVWGLCNEYVHAILENDGITEDCFLSGQTPEYRSNNHPAYNVRKLYESIKIVSGNAPIEKTRPKNRNDHSFRNLSYIARPDEERLLYRVYEVYLDSVLSFVGTSITIGELFVYLESSRMYSSLFCLEFSELSNDPFYKAMTKEVVYLMKNDSQVKKAEHKVSFVTLISRSPQ
jgi:hypothetical protein